MKLTDTGLVTVVTEFIGLGNWKLVIAGLETVVTAGLETVVKAGLP